MTLVLLVVDDEPDVEPLFRQRFRRDVRRNRFGLVFARSAKDALALIEDAAGSSLGLIFTDVNMPGMSGLDLIPRAKAARPAVPVVVVTAYSDAQTLQEALRRGAESLLTKPIDFTLVSDIVDRTIGGAA